MTDRIFPGAGINSFLRSSTLMSGIGITDSSTPTTGTVMLEDVAAVTPAEKATMTNPNFTVPVTSNDITPTTVNGKTPVASVLDKQNGYDASASVPIITPTGSSSTPVTAAGEALITGTSTPYTVSTTPIATTGEVSTVVLPDGTEATVGEPGDVITKEGYCFRPITTIKQAINKFINSNRRGVVVKDSPNVAQRIDEAAEGIKTTLTGNTKAPSEKNAIETFCSDQWHGVAVSVITLIFVLFIGAVMMALAGVFKIATSNGKENGKIDGGVSVYNGGNSMRMASTYSSSARRGLSGGYATSLMTSPRSSAYITPVGSVGYTSTVNSSDELSGSAELF